MIPAGAVIDSATFKIYLFEGDLGHTVNAYRISSAWGETTVNGQIFADAYAPGVLASFSTAIGWRTADLTQQVRAWRNGANANDGILLDDPATSGSATDHASEYSVVSDRPKLTVC